VFQTDGDVWSTTAVSDGVVYVTDASGALTAVDAKTGKARWKRKIADYTGLTNDNSRTTPAIVGDVLYLGNQGARTTTLGGAFVIAVNRKDGSPLWVTPVEPHPTAVITQSPVVYQDTVYVGVSSI
jgi:polyvinyl alcohol dehydrogenase (cytochrome)